MAGIGGRRGPADGASGSSGLTGGARAERRVFVKASLRRVWTTLHDPLAEAAIYPELNLGPPDPSWPAIGAARPGEIRLGLARTPVRVESTEIRVDSTFSIGIAGDGVSAAWRWTLEPLAGGTRVVHVGVLSSRDRLLTVLARLGRDSVGRLADAHLRALKEQAEAAETADAAKAKAAEAAGSVPTEGTPTEPGEPG